MPKPETSLTVIAEKTPAPYVPGALTVQDIVEHVRLVRSVLENVMIEGTHYGVIPGTEKYTKDGAECSKPTLYQPGAQTLLLTFRFRAAFEITQTELPNGHREIFVKTTLTTASGEFMTNGVGSCTTMESKYRLRRGEDFVDTGHSVPSTYWNLKPVDRKRALAQLMDDASGRFGVKKVRQADGNEAWHVVQYPDEATMVENPNIADTYNTVLKMAKKRSLVDATLNATAASDTFGQDLEELAENMEALQAATGIDLEGVTTAHQETTRVTEMKQAVKEQKKEAVATASDPAKPLPLPDWRNIVIHVGKRVNGRRLGEVSMDAIRALHTGWVLKLEDAKMNRQDRTLRKAILSAIIEDEALGKAKTLRDEQAESSAPGPGRPENRASGADTAESATEGHYGAINEPGASAYLAEIHDVLIANDISKEDLNEEMEKHGLFGNNVEPDFEKLDAVNMKALSDQLHGLLRQWGYTV